MTRITKESLDRSLRAWREAAETAIQEFDAYKNTSASETELIRTLESSGHAEDSAKAQKQYDEIILDHANRLITAMGATQRLASEYFHEKRIFDSQQSKGSPRQP